MTPPYRMIDDATGEVATGPGGEKWEGMDIPAGHKMELYDTTSTDGSPWQRVSPSEIVRPPDGGVLPPIDPPPIEPPATGDIQVGPGHEFTTLEAGIEAANDGDTITVDEGTYTNDFSTINKRLTIRGISIVDRPKLVATQSPGNGKGILVTNGDITIENMEFSGCEVPDKNGAGIRYEGGNLVIKDCLFKDNQNGMLCNPSDGTITITGTEFNHNGAGDGYSHNIYVNAVKELTMDGCYSHDAVVGHQIKSRAKKTTITNCRIDDGQGDGSYNVDLPECGVVLIKSCTLQQAAHAGNSTMVAYGMEKGAEAGASLTIDSNAFANEREAGVTMVNNNSSITAEITSNTVSGITEDQIVEGPANVSGTVYLDEVPPVEPPIDPIDPPPIDPPPATGDDDMDFPQTENELRALLQHYRDTSIVGMLNPRTSVDIHSPIEIECSNGSGVPWGVNGNFAKLNYKGSGGDVLKFTGSNGINNRGLTIKNLVIDGGDGGNMSGGGAACCLKLSAPEGDNAPIYRFHIEHIQASGAVNGLILEGGVYEGEVKTIHVENCTGDGIILRHLNLGAPKQGIVSNVLMFHVNSSRCYGAGLRCVYSTRVFGGSFILNGGGGIVAPDGIAVAIACNGENCGGEAQAVFDVPSNGYGSYIEMGEASSDGATHCRKWNGSDWESVGKPLLYFIAMGSGVHEANNHVSYYGGGANPMRVVK